MIDVVYTGDVRHNQKLKFKNHKMFLDRLKKKSYTSFIMVKVRKNFYLALLREVVMTLIGILII